MEKNDNDQTKVLHNELLKQKQKFSQMKIALDKQTYLIKLMLKKMDIRTETEIELIEDNDNDNESFNCNSDEMLYKSKLDQYGKSGQVNKYTV